MMVYILQGTPPHNQEQSHAVGGNFRLCHSAFSFQGLVSVMG